MFSVIGDTVVDPFLGTGTTMKVARETHRNSIGYEIDETLIPIIESRLANIDAVKSRWRPTVVDRLEITHRSKNP
jgi:DNA modification methylase